jgi:hypothetical protein
LEFDDSKFFIGRQFGIEVYNFEGNLIKTIKDTNFNKILFLDNYIAIIQFGINFSLSGGTKLKIKLLDKTNFKEIKSQQFDINGVQSVMLGTNNFVVFKNNIYFAESFTGNIFKINSSLEKVDSLKIFEFSELRSNICDSLKKSIDYFNKFGSFSNNIFDSMNIYINRVNWISGILADDSELIIVENSKNNRLDYFSNLINFNSKKIIRQELFKFKDVNNICKLKLNLISNSVKYLPSQNIGFSLSESGFFNCSKFNSWDDYISTMEKYFDERKMYYTIKIFN